MVFAASVSGQSTYLPLRYDEDWSTLASGAAPPDPFDPVKYISFGEGRGYLTLGGEIRETYERYHNDFTAVSQPDGYFLQRYLLHADWHMSSRFRFFVQVESSVENGRVGGPRRFLDKDIFDFNQGFLDVAITPGLVLRVGREELAFGSGRLVSRREGPNVLSSFDGARVIAKAGGWRIDLFATRPVLTYTGVADDVPNHASAFWGAYATKARLPVRGAHLDVYYLGIARKSAHYDKGTARELRHTAGARLWGDAGAWSYDAEVMEQFGTFGSGEIQAWRVASDTFRAFPHLLFAPRLGLRADIASGDHDPHGNGLGTFQSLFQSGLYSGKAGLLGPNNTINIEPSFQVQLARRVKLNGGWGFYWRESDTDALYDIAGNVWRPGHVNNQRFEGHRPVAEVLWQVDRHLAVQGNFTYVFNGPFGHTPPYLSDVSYTAVWATYKF